MCPPPSFSCTCKKAFVEHELYAGYVAPVHGRQRVEDFKFEGSLAHMQTLPQKVKQTKKRLGPVNKHWIH